MTLPRPGTPTSRAPSSTAHDDVRNALERASARQTAAHVAAGAVAKALLAEIGVSSTGGRWRSAAETGEDGWRAATDAARADRDTLGGVVEVVAEGYLRASAPTPRSGTASTPACRGRPMGIQAVKGVEIGDGFALARARGSEAHDELEPGLAAGRTARAGSKAGSRTASRWWCARR